MRGLEQIIFKEEPNDFLCKVAKNAEEAKALVEVGFEYVCTTPQFEMPFRKRKRKKLCGISQKLAEGINSACN